MYMLKSISHGIAARGLIKWDMRADMPCDVDLACIILFIIYYHVKIAVGNENKILKYLTLDLFVVTYFFIVTPLICFLAHLS
jgi:hypothetical protein